MTKDNWERRYRAKSVDGVWYVLEDDIPIWDATGHGNPRRAARTYAKELNDRAERADA